MASEEIEQSLRSIGSIRSIKSADVIDASSPAETSVAEGVLSPIEHHPSPQQFELGTQPAEPHVPHQPLSKIRSRQQAGASPRTVRLNSSLPPSLPRAPQSGKSLTRSQSTASFTPYRSAHRDEETSPSSITVEAPQLDSPSYGDPVRRRSLKRSQTEMKLSKSRTARMSSLPGMSTAAPSPSRTRIALEFAQMLAGSIKTTSPELPDDQSSTVDGSVAPAPSDMLPNTELFFLRAEHKRRIELERLVNQLREELSSERDKYQMSSTAVTGLRGELDRERAGRLKESRERKRLENEKRQLEQQKQAAEDEKNKLDGAAKLLDRELSRERKKTAELQKQVIDLETELTITKQQAEEADAARTRMSRYTERVRIQCQEAVESVTNELRAERNAHENVDKTIDELHQQIAEWQQKATKLEHDMQRTEQQRSDLAVRLALLNQHHAAAEGKLAKQLEVTKQHATTNEQFQTQISQLQEQLREARENREIQSKVADALEEAVTKRVAFAAEVDAANQQLTEELAALQKSNAKIEAEKVILQELIDEQDEGNAPLREELAKIQQSLDAAQQRIADLEEQLADEQQAHSTAQSRLEMALQDARSAHLNKADAIAARAKAESILAYEQVERHKVEETVGDLQQQIQRWKATIRKALSIAWENEFDELADHLIEAGCDVNTSDEEGYSMLHMAAAQGKVALVKRMIAEGAKVDAKNLQDATPLHQAASNGSDDVCTVLLENNADMNAVTNEGLTPLHCAAAQGHAGCIRIFMAKKADPLVVDALKRTPIHLAAINGSEECLRELVDQIALGSSQKSPRPLSPATPRKVTVDVRDMSGRTPLHYAAAGGHVACVAFLASKKPDLNAVDHTGKTPLHLAVAEADEPTVELLLSNGADITKKASGGYTALHIAANQGREHIVKCLLRHKAPVNVYGTAGESALIFAAGKGHIGVVRMLLEKKADVSHTDSDGCTALFYALDYEPIVTLLLDRGASLTAVDKDGATILHTACANGNHSVISLLLDRGAPVDAADSEGATPLHNACVAGDVTVATELLKFGANVKLATRAGHTALHVAAYHGSGELISLLLRYGADANAEDLAGKTALAHATESGNREAVDVLSAHMASAVEETVTSSRAGSRLSYRSAAR